MKYKRGITRSLAMIGALLFLLTGCSNPQEITEKKDISGLDLFFGTEEEDEVVLPKEIPVFKTVDLMGNEVTEAIFTGKDLTVVNMWGTFCSPCISEMPQLGAWAKELPENVQLIGLVGDIVGTSDTEKIALAKEIMTKAEAEFTNIVVSEDLYEFMGAFMFFPTTFFVDNTGKIVGEPIVGAYVDQYKTFVEEYLDENQ